MAGGFSKSDRPRLAGSYFNWEVEIPLDVQPSVGSIVAIPLTHDWGPLKSAVLCNDFREFGAIFGTGDTAGRRAVFQAFKGEAFQGRSGAGGVLVYRMGTGSAAKATRTLQNSTPANAVTLTARYHGTRGNDLTLTVQAGAAAGTKELLVSDGGKVVENFTFAQAAIAALVTDVNERSDLLEATLVLDGVALANVSAQALTGGNDGDTLTSTQWLEATNALEAERFSVITPFNLTDDTIRTTLQAWHELQNAAGKRAELVVGGAAGESASTANARSEAFNDPDTVNLGIGSLHDDVLERDLSMAELAPRVAGAIAARGERADLIYARFADLSLQEGNVLPTLAEQESALDAGTTVFSRDTAAEAPVFIREGVTTYSDDSASPMVGDEKLRPVKFYKRIKNLRIQHGVERETDDWATSGNVLGNQNVNEKTRAMVVGFVIELLQRRLDAGVIQPGFTAVLDVDPAPSDDDDFVQVLWGFHPTRSLRQIFSTARIG